jgi:hypothetical protein
MHLTGTDNTMNLKGPDLTKIKVIRVRERKEHL